MRRLGIGLAMCAFLVAVACTAPEGPATRSQPIAPASAPPATATPPPLNAKSPLGMNVAEQTYFSTQIPFVDVFKSASPWIPQKVVFGDPLDTKLPIALGPNGWPASLLPNQAAMALIFLQAEGHYPAGDYVCLYEGDGTIAFRNDAKITSQTPGRIVATVAQPTKNGIRLDITKTNPADPIRNIRVILPGFEATYAKQPFNPRFLEILAPFRLLRFMKWQRTDSNQLAQHDWSDRATTSYYTQADPARGVAIEYAVQLSNALSADAWVNVPHDASDDYVRKMATLLRDGLRPERRLYVEYTNEWWNAAQAAITKYTRAKGLERGLSTKDWEAGFRFCAERSVEVFRIFEEVFGSRQRLVRVIAAQHAGTISGTTALDWKDAYKSTDAYAVAPYFGWKLGQPSETARVLKLTVDEVLDEAAASIEENRKLTERQVAIAKAHGLDLISYEGGQSLAGALGAENNDALTALFQAANRHPRMKELYLRDLANWKGSGGKLYVQYASVQQVSKFGNWGALEYMDQDRSAAPKYQAMLEFIAKTPPWW